MASAPPPVFPLPPDWPIGADVLVRLGRVKGGRKADDRLDSTITQSEQTVRETHQRLLNERSQSVCSSLVFFIRAGVKTTVNLRPEGAKKRWHIKTSQSEHLSEADTQTNKLFQGHTVPSSQPCLCEDRGGSRSWRSSWGWRKSRWTQPGAELGAVWSSTLSK